MIAFSLSPHSAKAQTPLDTAADFTVKDITGVTHRLHEYMAANKLVVVDFFTITCGPCGTYAPMINDSYKHFGCNTGNVVFLGINWGADNQGVEQFGNEFGVEYPESSGLEGNGNSVTNQFGILSFPTVILIKPDYSIAENFIWPPETEVLDSIIALNGGQLAECTTGNNRPETSATRIWPNPASNVLYCKSTSLANLSIRLLSSDGHLVYSNNKLTPGTNCAITTKGFPNGCYILVSEDLSTGNRWHYPVIIQQ